MGMKTVEVNTSDFQMQVLDSDTPVLVDFWAEWCPPCKMLDPIMDEIATEYDGKLRVMKLDADVNQEIVMTYSVMGLPTLILFKGGEPVERIIGYKPKHKIVSQINAHVMA